MNAELLKSKWIKISSYKIINGYKSIRITSDCFPDLYIGVNESGCHSLILNLPKNHGINFQEVRKEKITMEFANDTDYLIMTLLDAEYNNIFDDLIVSLFNAIDEIEEVEVYSKVFIQTFYQWVLFFAQDSKEKLSKDIIKGIFGELFVLKERIQTNASCDINNLLIGWKGPYDQGHDFVYEDLDIEVKTKDIRKATVNIASEEQLNVELGKQLILTVLSIDEDVERGISLQDIVLDIKKMVFERFGDFTIILKGLLQKGITLINIQEYNNYRFVPITLHEYDCLSDAFPRIISSNISSSIRKVRYELNLSRLESFIILSREF